MTSYNKQYSIQRKVVKVKTGWFRSKDIPLWCLVEKGVHRYYDSHYYGMDTYDNEYETVLLSSEDYDYMHQEYLNFSGEFK